MLFAFVTASRCRVRARVYRCVLIVQQKNIPSWHPSLSLSVCLCLCLCPASISILDCIRCYQVHEWNFAYNFAPRLTRTSPAPSPPPPAIACSPPTRQSIRVQSANSLFCLLSFDSASSRAAHLSVASLHLAAPLRPRATNLCGCAGVSNTCVLLCVCVCALCVYSLRVCDMVQVVAIDSACASHCVQLYSLVFWTGIKYSNKY